MCAWTITAVRPLDDNAVLRFDPEFEAHMMKGNVKDGSHRGLHSLNQILGTNYRIQPGHKIDDSNCPQVFSAKVSLVKNMSEVQAYSKQREWAEEKLSFFFPTSMTFDEIKRAVTLAHQNYMGSKQGLIPKMPKHQPDYQTGTPKVSYDKAKSDSMKAFQSQLKKLNVTELGVKWAGKVKIENGGNSWIIWVGSPQTGSESSKLLGAHPAVRGRFI
jgi:hypothetical protein